MSAFSRRALLIAALGCSASCEGPTLEVGERAALLRDAATVPNDAETPTDFDASDGSRRPRDASADVERHACHDDRECLVFSGREHCNLFTGRCVECVDERDCPSGPCALPQGVCVGDRGHDPSTPPSFAP